MIKRLVTSFLGACLLLMLLGLLLILIPLVRAVESVEAVELVESVEARRSDAAITVNGVRMPFSAYDIAGRTYLDIFEVALALSDTESRFTLRWINRKESIQIVTGRSFAAIGLDLTGKVADVETATPIDVSILLDGDEVFIPAFSINNDIYFDISGIAGALDFYVDWDPTENLVGIKTDQSYEYEDIIIIRSIDPMKPMVALTFDDGPSLYTIEILDALERYGAVATFYVLGDLVEGHSDIVLRAFNMGNEIASHAWSHRYLTVLSEDNVRTELLNTNDVIESVIGETPVTVRPPYGEINNRVVNVITEFGLPIIHWSVDPTDWRTRDADATFEYVMDNVTDRDIILLHDIYEPTAEAARRLIPALINRGFQLVTVSELLYHSGITPEPGEVYKSG